MRYADIHSDPLAEDEEQARREKARDILEAIRTFDKHGIKDHEIRRALAEMLENWERGPHATAFRRP